MFITRYQLSMVYNSMLAVFARVFFMKTF